MTFKGWIRKHKQNCKILAGVKEDTGLNKSDEVWLLENRRRLLKISRELYTDLKRIGKTFSDSDDPIGLFELCKDFIETYTYSINEAAMIEFLQNNQDENRYFKLSELGALQTIIGVLCVDKIVEEINKSNYKTGNSGVIGLVIEQIYSLSEIDFEFVLSTVSVTEKILRIDPDGTYCRCDKETVNMYRRKISEICGRDGVDELKIVNKYVNLAKESEGKGSSITYYIMKDSENKWGRLYFILLRVLPLIGVIILSVISVKSNSTLLLLLSVFSFFPIRSLVKMIAESCISQNHSSDIIPRININSIPDDGKTMILYTCVLSNAEIGDSLFRKIEKYACAYKDNNLKFGVLFDFKDADQAKLTDDEMIIAEAKKWTDKINSKNRSLTLYWRDRTYSESERKYMGNERKRGAQEELFSHLYGQQTSLYTYGEVTNGVRYVLALDSDSEIMYDHIMKLIGTALHPYNQCEYRTAVGGVSVSKGYGIIQPKAVLSLKGIDKRCEYLIHKYAFEGRSSYESAAFSLYQKLFGIGTYCGKGLINVEAYNKCLVGAFPKETILSHDIPEGLRIRCGFASDISIFDSPPASYKSERKREHRWLRGDLQSLVLAKKYIYDKKGDKYKNTFSYTERMILIEPLYKIILDALRVPAVILSLYTSTFLGGVIFIIFISDEIFSFVKNAIGSIGVPKRKYLSRIPDYYSATIFTTAYNILSAADRCVLSFDVLFRTYYRMKISRCKLLEWTVFDPRAGTDRSTLKDHLYLLKTSVVIGALSIMFSLLAKSPYMLMLLLIGLSFCVFPFWMYSLSKVKNSIDTNHQSSDSLRKDALRMWQYFSCYVNEKTNHLPPDNVTFLPEFRIAERTSPTNIGMYMLSVLNAFDFGFIDGDELYRRLSCTVETVKSLEKWHGHLYNWYDTKNMTVLYPAYVSTVDSGNFVVSLLTVKNGLYKVGALFDNLISDIDALISGADFSKLYNRKRDLFYIGYNSIKSEYDKNVYDLYPSEMLTTSFYAVANGVVPQSHIKALSRIFSDGEDVSTMLSWNGSTFEYFMPSIFLPNENKTERGEMLLSAHFYQKAFTADFCGIDIYGSSESAFYDFDDARNYAYKAHGAASLALSPNAHLDRVYAPYSLYLMAEYDSEISNVLDALGETNLSGKYGLYDAVDLTQKRVGKGYGVTRLYMSHHIGMSITSLANYCLTNINRKRFMSSPKLYAAEHLLYSKNEICRKAADSDLLRKAEPPRTKAVSEGVISKSGTSVISNGRERIIADDNGRITLYSGTKLITAPPSRNVGGFHVLIKIGDSVYNCTSQPEHIAGTKSSYYFNGAEIVYINEFIHEECLVTTTLSLCVDDTEAIYSADLSVNGVKTEYEVLFFAVPVMNNAVDYKSSPSYSDLFISAESNGGREVTYKRRTDSGEDIKLNVGIFGCKVESVFTRSHEALFFSYGIDDLKRLFSIESSAVSGPCVHPLYAAVVRQSSVNENITFRLALECDIPNESHENILKGATAHFSLVSVLSGADKDAVKTATDILTSIYSDACVVGLTDINDVAYSRDILWRHGISGDLPIYTVFVNNTEKSSTAFILEELLRSKRYLFISGVRFDLLIISEDDGYHSSGIGIIRSLAEKTSCMGLLGKNNGIFILNKSSVSKNDTTIISALSSGVQYIGTQSNDLSYRSVNKKNHRHIVTELQKSSTFEIVNEDIKITNGYSQSPWCMVYANKNFGTLLTNRSSGFTWYRNSALMTSSARHRDPIIGDPGETVEMITENSVYDLLAEATVTEYRQDCAVYSGCVEKIKYEVMVGVDTELPSKLYCVSLPNWDGEQKLSIRLSVYPPAPAVVLNEKIELLQTGDFALNMFSLSEHGINSDSLEMHAEKVTLTSEFTKGYLGFVFSSIPLYGYDEIYNKIKTKFQTTASLIYAFNEYREKKISLLPPIKYVGEHDWIEPMLNYSAYQALYFRLYARCGYSQPGGAYGFRDQLQDSLSALYYSPDITKEQILRSCCRQYTDGRVQHWWHDDGAGLKSRCSDDYMWLPYVLAEYLLATGDHSVLMLKQPCLSSPELKDGEENRYENVSATETEFTVLEHAMMAIKASAERGNHGLPLILSGDWNDGMNAVGKNGVGESVWLAFFFAITYRKLAEALDAVDPIYKPYLDELNSMADTLIMAAESAWDGDWYLRAYDDNGKKVGSVESAECKIDIIPQAFSVFARASDERSVLAMESVYRELYDDRNGILRLFAPSYRNIREYGYISKYPAGIRENGGQYTHAAIWAIIAYFELGAYGRAMELLTALTPLNIYSRGAMNGRYTAEPYLICADVYHGEGITGKSGWSGYTGSAAWYYRTIMKYVLGIEPVRGNIKLTPPPESVNGNYSVSFDYLGCKINYTVIYDDTSVDGADFDRVLTLKKGASVIIEPKQANMNILLKVIK